ncbi:hypothetical protein PIB30_075790, partial [Stylosanthes scabra]|nr:hypothetical protein [Stylosanthes scabra]
MRSNGSSQRRCQTCLPHGLHCHHHLLLDPRVPHRSLTRASTPPQPKDDSDY